MIPGFVPAFQLRSVFPEGRETQPMTTRQPYRSCLVPRNEAPCLRGNHYCKSLCRASSHQHHSLRASPCSCEPPFPLSSPFSIPLKSTHICFPGNLTITKDMSQKGLKRDGLEKGQDQKAKQIWPLMRCAWPIAI